MEVSSGEDRKKSKIKKNGRDIEGQSSERGRPHGLPKFAKFSPAALKKEENCNEIKSNFAVMSKEQKWMRGDIGGLFGLRWIRGDIGGL